jgi:integrase
MGSLYKRKSDGRWVASISIGPRGKQRRITRYAGTRKEAGAELDELRKLVPTPGGARTTVGAYLRSWLDVVGRRSLKASTWRTYDAALRHHIEPAIGHIALGRLTAEHVDMLIGTLDLAPKGQRNVLGFLSRVLEVAVARGYLARNVARLVQPPRLVHDEPDALTIDQAKAIVAAVKDDRLEALWLLALSTGLRQAELLGLRWQDIDLDAATLRVAFALARVDGRYVLDEPKTPRSRRTVGLPAFAVTALREHRTRQRAERIAAGVPTIEGLVFVSPEGRPLNGGWVSHRWPKLAEKAGVDVTMHQLRHGQASLLVALGVHPRVIGARLGHATALVTDRYSHVAEASDGDAAALLDEALG